MIDPIGFLDGTRLESGDIEHGPPGRPLPETSTTTFGSHKPPITVDMDFEASEDDLPDGDGLGVKTGRIDRPVFRGRTGFR